MPDTPLVNPIGQRGVESSWRFRDRLIRKQASCSSLNWGNMALAGETFCQNERPRRMQGRMTFDILNVEGRASVTLVRVREVGS